MRWMGSPFAGGGDGAAVDTRRRLFGGVEDFWLDERLIWPSREAI